MIYRKAKFDDVEAIYELVADYAQQGVMPPRLLFGLNSYRMIISHLPGPLVNTL